MSNVPPTRFLNLLCARTTKGGKLLGGYYGGKDLLKFHEHLKIVVHSISMKYILFFPALFLWQPRSYVQVEFLGSVHSEYELLGVRLSLFVQSHTRLVCTETSPNKTGFKIQLGRCDI